MTVVTGSFNQPGQSGNTGTSGSLWWVPTARHTSGSGIVLPLPFTVPVDVNGTMTPITVDPTGPMWVWKVTEQFNGIAQNVVRYVQVPASGTVAYKDLVDVDPSSLQPNAPLPGVVDGGSAALANRFIQPRRDTAANWTSANPVLAQGEAGLETDTGRRKIGDGITAWTALAYQIDKATADATYIRANVIAPAPTGIAATDTANLQAAINAVPDGGLLSIPWIGEYNLNATLTFAANISVRGAGFITNYQTAFQDSIGGTPPFKGTVLRVMANGIDALSMQVGGKSVNLEGFSIIFDSTLTSTGHGINTTGLCAFTWRRLGVWGHDGNHYAYVWVNPSMGLTEMLWATGGGGFYTSGTDAAFNSGNLTHIQPLVILKNSGTAHGYYHTATRSAALNLLTYIRPQCNMETGNGSQYNWYDDPNQNAKSIVALSPDLEVSASKSIGNCSQFVGYGFLIGNTGNCHYGISTPAPTLASYNSSFGQSALGGLQTGIHNVALGYQAGVSVSTQSDVTAIGYQAGGASVSSKSTAIGSGSKTGNANAVAIGYGANAAGWGSVAIGCDSTTTGASTSNQNEMALGTALHRIKILGRLNVAQRTPTSGADASGVVGDIMADDNYLYAKTTTGWKRAALTTW